MTPTFKISNNAPSNILLWNNLANLNSNFFQSTNYDKIQALYKNQPVYFELWSNENLIAGVKLYYWESNRLGFFSKIISKYIFQYSELLFNYKFSYLLNLNDASSLLQQSVNGYIKANDIVTAQV